MDKSLIVESLKIENFRGLNGLTIDDFSVVNIFVGANNSGKTSVLEALKLLGSPNDIGQVVRLALQRAQVSPEARKKNLINYILSILQKVTDEDGQNYYRIKLGGDIRGRNHAYEVDGTIGEIVDSTGATRKALDVAIKTSVDRGKTSYQSVQVLNDEEAKFAPIEKPVYNALYLHSSVSYYRSCVNLLTSYIVEEGKDDVLQILQTFDRNIDDISIVGEDIYLHNVHSGSIPLFAYGSGLQKAVFLTIAIAYCKNGVILIDEIDNAIHVSAFEDVFKWFLNACIRWNVQAFITTHSAEAIDAILKIAHSEHSNDDVLRIITLRKDFETNTTRKKVRSGEDAYSDRLCYKAELRV